MTKRISRLESDLEDAFAATVVDYAHNLIVGTRLRKMTLRNMISLEDIDLVLDLVLPRRETLGTSTQRDRTQSALRSYVLSPRRKLRKPRPSGLLFRTNFEMLGDAMALDRVEREILQFLMIMHLHSDLKQIAEQIGSLTMAAAVNVIAAATGISVSKVYAACKASGRLRESRLVTFDGSMMDLPDKFACSQPLLDAILSPELDRARLMAVFLVAAPPTSLEWSDVAHIREQAEFARELLGSTLRSQRAGVNLLFYGPSGTGKTELATLLARELGATLYSAVADSEIDKSEASDRLSALSLGQCMLRDKSSLLMFDELEDLFEWSWFGAFGDRAHGEPLISKLQFNRMLETNPIPTIWITNRTSGIDPAFLRRFMYVVEFKPLGVKQRATVLRRHLADESSFDAADVEQIAARYDVSAAQLATAVCAARIVAPDGRPVRETVEKVLEPVRKLVHGTQLPDEAFDPQRYTLSAINASEDLTALAERLADWQPGAGPGIALCLYGAPGTGKSEYARYLAHAMGRRVVCRRSSDIVRPYLGETEMRIAEAFREAEQEEAVLLFDEADSFLRARGKARYGWEVSQVNEFLQQLERQRGVVVCTTNLWGDLDEAALRRFTFKVEFDFLRPEQAVALFEVVFGDLLEAALSVSERAAIQSELSRVRNLSAGDFAVVSRRQRALRRRSAPGELLSLLLAEVRAKGVSAQRIIGFNHAEPRVREA